MITEDDLREINGLVSRFRHPRTTKTERGQIQERLRELGVLVEEKKYGC